MLRCFLEKYFLTFRVAILRKEICANEANE
jgi:hypothetical protein